MRYWYFASTLPGFLFGSPPPIDEKEFLERCKQLVDPEDYTEIESCIDLLLAPGEPLSARSAFLGQYLAWERSFRRHLAILRAQAGGKDGSRYQTGSLSVEGAAQSAASCFGSADPYQAELAFERERWMAAERLSTFSTFDLDFIMSYRIKLNIACRLARLEKSRGEAGYRHLYDEIIGGAPGVVETLSSGAQA